jgi:hypothetical protein
LLSQISSHLRKECYCFSSSSPITIALYLAYNTYSRSYKIANMKVVIFCRGVGVSWIQTNIRSKYVCLIIFIHSVRMLYTYV